MDAGEAGEVIMEMKQGEQRMVNDHFGEALYNEKRNAIPSWQGYEYQGKVALRKYLEILSGLCAQEKTEEQAQEKTEEQALEECAKVSLKIEWLEDFVVYRSGRLSEIYQVKKTLKTSSRAEVIANFILQYKLMGRDDMEWFLVFDEVSSDEAKKALSESEFDNLYGTAVEKGFGQELEELRKNRTPAFWKENLKLSNQMSTCKNSRAYLQRLFELEGMEGKTVEYTTATEIDAVCRNYLEPILNRCKKDKEDYQKFSSKLKIIQMPVVDIKMDCEKFIEDIGRLVRRNQMLSAEDIFQKMSCDMDEKLEAIRDRKEKENYVFCFDDVKKACRDEDNTIYKWRFRLSETKERLLNELAKVHCEKCTKGNQGQGCSGCIYSEMKEWKMEALIDAMNLEHSNFCVETVMDSITNKISDAKVDLMIDMIESYDKECRMNQEGFISVRDDQYFMSSVLCGRNAKSRVLPRLLKNYWEHTRIYRDYEYILTDQLDYELDEENISFLKEHYEDDQAKSAPESGEVEREKIRFLDTRRTKFIDYRGGSI